MSIVLISVSNLFLSINTIAGELSSTTAPEERQGSVLESEPLVTLDEVTVTATREERFSFEVPQAVTIVDRKQINQQTPAVLPDLLRGREGIFVQQTTPGQASPIVRGLIGSSVLTLVDGMRLNTAFFRPAPNQYLALVDPYNTERIEIVRGPGSTLYGSDAMGGVINILSPVPRVDSEQWTVQGRALGQFGSADSSGITRLSLQGGKKGIAVAGGATYQNHDDLRSGGSMGPQRPSGYRSYAADGKLFLDGDGQDLLLNVQYLQQPNTPRFDELVPGFGQTQPSSSVFLFEPNDRLFLHGRYRLLQPLSFVDHLQVNLSFQEINDDRRTRDFDSPLELRERNRSSLTGLTMQLTSQWKKLVTFTYGGEIYLDKIKSSQTGRNIGSGATPVQQSRFPDGSTLNSFAVYGQGELHIHPRLTAITGGRLSYFDIAIPQADRGIGADLQVLAPTGSLGLIYHLRPDINLVTNVGRAFRVPNVFDLSTLGERPGNRFNIPNANLKPEHAVSVDAGVKMESSRFSAEAFGFYMKVHDKIEATPTGSVTPSGRQIVQSVNINTLVLFGAEIAGRVRPRKGWEWFGSLTFTKGEEKGLDGRAIPADRIPPLNGQAGISYRPLTSIWGEVFVRFALRQKKLSDRDRTDPRINPNGTPGWVTANVRLSWVLSRNFTARLAAENLLDQGYREHGSGINAAGRSLIGSLEARF